MVSLGCSLLPGVWEIPLILPYAVSEAAALLRLMAGLSPARRGTVGDSSEALEGPQAHELLPDHSCWKDVSA